MASTPDGPLPNAEVARLLREIGDLLELDQANPFRIRAYRNAARTIDGLTEPISVVDARPETVLETLLVSAATWPAPFAGSPPPAPWPSWPSSGPGFPPRNSNCSGSAGSAPSRPPGSLHPGSSTRP